MPARTHQEGMDTVLQFNIDLTSREMRWIYLALWKQYVSTFPGWLFRNNWVKPLEEKGGTHLKSWGGQSPKESKRSKGQLLQWCSGAFFPVFESAAGENGPSQCRRAAAPNAAMLGAWITRQLLVLLVPHFAEDCGDYTLIITPWKWGALLGKLHPRPSKIWQLGACSSKAFSLEHITCLEPTTHTEIWTDLIHLKFNQRKWAIFFTAHSWNPKKWFFSSVQSPCFSGKFGIVPSIWGNIIIHEWGFLSTKLYKNKMTGWWLGTFFIFHNIWDVILPIDFHIFQDG